MRVYRPMRRRGHGAQLYAPSHRPMSSPGYSSARLRPPQSRPPLHPVRLTYKQPDPARVLLPIKHNISFTPMALAVWKKGEAFDPTKLNVTTWPFREVRRQHDEIDSSSWVCSERCRVEGEDQPQ
jgi:hypothetical protein